MLNIHYHRIVKYLFHLVFCGSCYTARWMHCVQKTQTNGLQISDFHRGVLPYGIVGEAGDSAWICSPMSQHRPASPIALLKAENAFMSIVVVRLSCDRLQPAVAMPATRIRDTKLTGSLKQSRAHSLVCVRSRQEYLLAL